MNKFQRILFYVAMEEEAQFLLPGLGLKETACSASALPGSRRYSRKVQDREIHLVVPGRDSRFGVNQVGTLAAAITVFAETQEFHAHLIINPGSAGGYRSRGADIGDVYLSTGNFYFHDRRISLPGYNTYGEGVYPSFDSTDLAKRTGLKTGVVSSGNSLDATPPDQASMDSHNAVIKDMEAAAVAWIGWELHIPVLAVKAITDFVDEPNISPLQFVKNFALAHVNLSRALKSILESI